MATTAASSPRLLARAPSPYVPHRSGAILRPPSISVPRRPPSCIVSRRRRRPRSFRATSQDTTSNNEEEQAAGKEGSPEEAKATKVDREKTPEVVAAELKEALRSRKEAEGGGAGLWAGVAEEMAEIEWPAPGKVVGTTGVVLGVIAGSTAALLSVNALLAELSDRVFAGKGIQDFFSG